MSEKVETKKKTAPKKAKTPADASAGGVEKPKTRPKAKTPADATTGGVEKPKTRPKAKPAVPKEMTTEEALKHLQMLEHRRVELEHRRVELQQEIERKRAEIMQEVDEIYKKMKGN